MSRTTSSPKPLRLSHICSDTVFMHLLEALLLLLLFARWFVHKHRRESAAVETSIFPALAAGWQTVSALEHSELISMSYFPVFKLDFSIHCFNQHRDSVLTGKFYCLHPGSNRPTYCTRPFHLHNGP